jgi:hypothetical protein
MEEKDDKIEKKPRGRPHKKLLPRSDLQKQNDQKCRERFLKMHNNNKNLKIEEKEEEEEKLEEKLEEKVKEEKLEEKIEVSSSEEEIIIKKSKKSKKKRKKKTKIIYESSSSEDDNDDDDEDNYNKPKIKKRDDSIQKRVKEPNMLLKKEPDFTLNFF